MPGPLDLRKNKPAAPNPAPQQVRPLPIPGSANGLGGLPQPQGTVLKLTKTEQDFLEGLDWKPGDPIPDVATMLEQVRTEEVLPDPNMPRVPRPLEININDLPPEKQAELKRGVATAIENTKNLAALAEHHVADPTNPEVNRQIDALRMGSGSDQFHVPAPPPQPAQYQVAPPPVAAPHTQPPVPAREDSSLQTMAAVDSICNNCHQDPNADVIEVTEDDKLNFLTMMITGAPFLKEYPLLGGKAVAVFRSMSRLEFDLAITQAGCDSRDGLIPNPAEFFRAIQNYEMVISLHQVRTDGGQTISLPLSVAEVAYDKPEPGEKFQTVLKSYAPYVMDQVSSASMFRLLSALYLRFNALIRRLEAASFNADFWAGIKTPV